MEASEVSRLIDQTFAAYSAGDLDGFVAGMAEDMHYEDNSGGPLEGRAAFKKYASGWFNACSEGSLTPGRRIISEDEAAVEMHFEGTHDRADMFGVSASGTPLSFDFVVLLRFANGALCELKAFYNPATAWQALGILGELPTTPT